MPVAAGRCAAPSTSSSSRSTDWWRSKQWPKQKIAVALPTGSEAGRLLASETRRSTAGEGMRLKAGRSSAPHVHLVADAQAAPTSHIADTDRGPAFGTAF